MANSGLESRVVLIDELTDALRSSNHTCYVFIGPKGSGKKYVLNGIAAKLSKDTHIMHFICDSFVEKTKKKNTYAINLSFDASFYVGVNLSISKDYSTKLNAILNSLKSLSIKRKNVLICVEDYDDLSSEQKDIIKTIVENKAYFAKQLKARKFQIIITAINKLRINCRIKQINFTEYSQADVIKYLAMEYSSLWNNLDVMKQREKSTLLYNYCRGNLYLINLIAPNVLSKDYTASTDISAVIDKIVDQQLSDLRSQGVTEYNLAPGIIEDFLITCSLSLDYFNKILIEQVGEISSYEVSNSLKLSNGPNMIIDKLPNLQYHFISEQIKNNLAQRLSDMTKYIRYYNYYTQKRNDEYFSRAFYLYKSLGYVEINTYNLIILAVSKSMMFNDDTIENRIFEKIDSINEQFKMQINLFSNAYKQFNAENYDKSIEILKSIDTYLLNSVGRAEYNRLFFKNLYLSKNIKMPLILKYLESLKRITSIDNDLSLNLPEMFMARDEIVLKLRIIFDIAPFVLDNLNDVKEFERLYDASRILCKNENTNASPFAEYIKNVFNRKAFLFVNSLQAESYYEEAEAYFYNNSNWIQYLMTLSGKAGILMAQSRYNDSIETCQRAYNTINTYDIKLPQAYKLRNNLLISQFLLFEQEHIEESEIFDKATEIINELLKIKNSEEKVSYVIPLNIASLYLYQDKFVEYESIKKMIENEMGCANISDINDLSVDDFYRYRFAWMEIYKYMRNGDFNQCKDIIGKLKGFVPSLSFKQEVLWDKKLQAVEDIINCKKNVSAFYFCNNLYCDKRPSMASLKFFYRGLPLSALQYTSFS